MYLAEECLQGAACGCLLIRERHHELLELCMRLHLHMYMYMYMYICMWVRDTTSCSSSTCACAASASSLQQNACMYYR